MPCRKLPNQLVKVKSFILYYFSLLPRENFAFVSDVNTDELDGQKKTAGELAKEQGHMEVAKLLGVSVGGCCVVM